ncbi:MAG: DbpA RNA binding domain-containing protein, partial [Anaerolineae bacterium]|nr:DbpA RNA binding domain-containing protein [Anaerolineae bacterium]
LAHEGRPLTVPLEPEPELMPHAEDGMVRLFVDAGRNEGVRPGDIVGAIANEANIPGKAIGAIDIYDHFTYVDVPAKYSQQVLERMANAEIRRRQANIRVASAQEKASAKPARREKRYAKGKRRWSGRRQ